MRYAALIILLTCTACGNALYVWEEEIPCPSCLPKTDLEWKHFDFAEVSEEDPAIEGDPAMPLGGSLRPCVSSQLDDPGCNDEL